MSPNQWPEPDGSPQPSHHQTALDRQMIRHLASRYSPEELSRLFQEEGNGSSSAKAADQASIVSSYASSTLSEEPPSVFDSASSIRSFSDTSSITGSIFSNVSSKLLGRKSQASSAQAAAVAQAQVQAAQSQSIASWTDAEMAAPDTVAGSESSTPTLTAPKQKTAFMCGFCKEEGITKTCTRKNDLKRHIEDFHNTNAQWWCRHRGCQMIFDWQTAYKTHLKQSHGGSRMSLDEAKVNLCPQVVFACGFEDCSQIYEADGDNGAAHTFKEYVSHVVKHFDEGAQSVEWSYSMRMRNLLRQNQVSRAWVDCGWNDVAKNGLDWQPQTSGILRKRLECRHIGDVKLLVHYALQLGDGQTRITKFREDFVTPILDTCAMSMPGHQPCKSAPTQDPVDPFQFRISRGTNPSLATYLASQRRLYTPSARHRAVQSSHPHPHPHQHQHLSRSALSTTPTSNPMNGPHFFTGLSEASPGSPLYDSTPHPYSPTAQMMQQAGGIIADDLRSLRSMTNGSPEPDIDMGDASLMSPDFTSAYSTGIQSSCAMNGLPSPAPLEQASPFYHEGAHQQTHPHAF